MSVAVWWAIFSIPILTRVPEPSIVSATLAAGENALTATFRHLRGRISDIRQYRELFKYLIAFLIYNDGIGTVIGVGAIYGAELGIGREELILALLMIQFAGIPFSLLFGRLPSPAEKRRATFLAFVVFNLIVMPIFAVIGGRVLPAELVGATVGGATARVSSLGAIFGMIVGLQVVGAAFAFVLGKTLFSKLAESMDTLRSILLSLLIFVEIAVMGFVLDSVLEYWFLAWMVAIVLGGSQALSRSLYASMSPDAKSGEFFGLYSVMAKFSAIIGPALFAAVVAIFGSSRPAILSLVAIFAIGGYLLTRVDVAEGRRVAKEEDDAILAASGAA